MARPGNTPRPGRARAGLGPEAARPDTNRDGRGSPASGGAKMDRGQRLLAILEELDDGVVWRPVRDANGRLLAKGSGIGEDGLSEYLQGVSFSGKTVCDMGCNLGYFSFMAARDGATMVEGLDVDPLVVEGAGILADMQGLANVRFRVADFTAETPETPFDMVLLVDFIGRGTIVKGRLDAVLAAAARFAAKEMLFTLRPIYACRDLDPRDEFGLPRIYGTHFVRDGRFFLLDYVASRLPDWEARMLTPGGDPARRFKHAVRFTKT